MSVTAAVNNSTLSDSTPRLPAAMAAGAATTTYAELAAVMGNTEFIPSRATRPSNNPLLRDSNIHGPSIVKEKDLYCDPARLRQQRQQQQQQARIGQRSLAGSTTGPGQSQHGDTNRGGVGAHNVDPTGVYLALDWKTQGRTGDLSTRTGSNTSDSTTGYAPNPTDMANYQGCWQEARGLQPSDLYANLVQVNDRKQAHAWMGGSAQAAENAMQATRQRQRQQQRVAEERRKAEMAMIHMDGRYDAMQHQYVPEDRSEWPVAGVQQAGYGSEAHQASYAPGSRDYPPHYNYQQHPQQHHHQLSPYHQGVEDSIYVNGEVAVNHMSSCSPPHASRTNSQTDEPVYVNSGQSSSNDWVFPPRQNGSHSGGPSPNTSPLSSPRFNSSVPCTPGKTTASPAISPSYRPDLAPASSQQDVTYENTKSVGKLASRVSGMHISHTRSPSEPLQYYSGCVGGEFGSHLVPPGYGPSAAHSYSSVAPEHTYMNSPQTAHISSSQSQTSLSVPVESGPVEPPRPSKAKTTEADIIDMVHQSTAAVSPSSPSSPPLSPLASPGLEDSVDVNHSRRSWQTSDADTLFGSFQLQFVGAEPVDRGYGVIAQAVRSAVRKNMTAMTKVTMKVSATAVTVLTEEGVQKFRHEVDSIESISPWQESALPLPADLASYAAYIVVQEAQSAVCFVFQATDPGARRTVCKTIESALYADVKNFKSMTYPKYDLAKPKSASQFSVKYIGSILVQTTFRVIDEAARRLLANTNPAKINFAFMSIGEDRIRLASTTTSVIFAAHPTSTIASLDVFSEDGRVFGYVVKQKGSGTKCHVFRCSRPSLAFAIVDIIKEVIQDNYKAEAEENASKPDTQKTNGILGLFGRRKEKKPRPTVSSSSSTSNLSSSLGPDHGPAVVEARVRSVSDINPPLHGLDTGDGPKQLPQQHRVDYLGNLSIQQDTLNDPEARQVVEKLNSVRRRSYMVSLNVSERGIIISDDHGKTREISVRSIMAVRLHPENAHYALVVSRPQTNSTIRYCHVVHQPSRMATDILRDVTKLLV